MLVDKMYFFYLLNFLYFLDYEEEIKNKEIDESMNKMKRHLKQQDEKINQILEILNNVDNKVVKRV